MHTVEDFLPVLFAVLFGFIIVNMVINFVLLAIKKKRMYMLLSIFWPMALGSFFLNGYFQNGDLAVTLAYSGTFIPMTILAMIGFEAAKRKFPLKNYIAYYFAVLVITLGINSLKVGFTTLAMPLAIATATPLIHAAIYLLCVDRKNTTMLQKFLSVIYLVSSVHCINFAVFRMAPGAQLWGWITSYALYDILAVLMPAMALEEASITENVRLNDLVKDKTADLNESLKQNDKLLKILIHDISNPLMVIKLYLQVLKVESIENLPMIESIKKAQIAIEGIVNQVKDHYLKKSPTLNPVCINECFDDVTFIFAKSLEKKNVTLKFHNNLSTNTKVKVDKMSFTHSVLSNLVSNGLKFTSPNTEIRIIAKEENNFVVLEIEDQGPGIPQEVISKLMSNDEIESTQGSMGEVGTGFGLSIAKSYIEAFGGEIEFNARYIQTNPLDHGTNVRITLDRIQ